MTAARRATVRALVFAPLLLVHPVVASAPQPSPPARTVSLRVVDRLGRPVAGVSACLLPACARVDLRAGEGGITATLQASDAPVRLRVSARGFDPAELTVEPSPAAPAAEPGAPAPPTDVTLKAKGSVRLALLSFDEKRTVHVSLSLKETVDPRTGTKGRLLATREAPLEPRPARGAVVLDDVPPGDWVLSWEGPGLCSGSKGIRVAEAPADAGTVEVRAGRAVPGAVRDDLGMVVAGARVSLRPAGTYPGGPHTPERSAKTGSDGAFAVVGLPADEPLSWSARSDEHEDADGTLGGETRLEVVLTRAQRVAGRLVDDDGRPVAGVEIGVTYVRTDVTVDEKGKERRSTRVNGHPGLVRSGEGGTFAFFRRSPDSMKVEPSAGDWIASAFEVEPLAEGAARGYLDLGDLVLRKGRTLAGRVLAASDGSPVAGAAVDAVWREEGSRDIRSARAATAEDGAFRLAGLLPGRPVTLTARKEKYAPRTVEVDEEADSVDVLLGRGGRIEGRACGTAWELAHVVIWYGTGGGISNRNQVDVDAAGRFVLENAEPGTVTLERSWRFRDVANPAATSGSSGAFQTTVTVKEDATVTATLACDGIPLSGVVTRGGRPLGGSIVTFRLEEGAAADALLDPAGGFSTRVPAPGRWLVSAYPVAADPSAATACEVPPGGLEGCRVDLAPLP